MDELRESFITFGELTIPEYQSAIRNAYLKEREAVDHDPKYFPRLDMLKIKKQLQHSAGHARDRRNAHINTLPPPNENRRYCTPREWVNLEFPKIWANFKAFGEVCVPPFWDKTIRGYDEGQEFALLFHDLNSHPDFTQAEKEAMERMANIDFLNHFAQAMRVQQINAPLMPENFAGSDKQREFLKSRIERYNDSSTIRKFKFDVDAAHQRSIAMGVVKAYGRIVLDKTKTTAEI